MSTTTEPSSLTERPVRKRDARHARRAHVLKWLRKTHGWVGLWAMTLTVLFGVTGLLQNHRATLHVETPATTVVHVPLRPPLPATPDALAARLRNELMLDGAPFRVRREPARRVTWGERSLVQPEHWQLRFAAPDYTLTADYWKGGHTVEVKRQQRGPIGTLEAFHKATGTSLAWALLSDSVAVGLVFLSLTGLTLWLGLERRRRVGVIILSISLLAAVVIAIASL